MSEAPGGGAAPAAGEDTSPMDRDGDAAPEACAAALRSLEEGEAGVRAAVVARCAARASMPAPEPPFLKAGADGRVSIGQLRLGAEVGRGSYSSVVFARLRGGEGEGGGGGGGGIFAVKCVRKKLLLREKKQGEAVRERDALAAAQGCAWVVQLLATAQDADCLYFVFPHLPNGDLRDLVRV